MRVGGANKPHLVKAAQTTSSEFTQSHARGSTSPYLLADPVRDNVESCVCSRAPVTSHCSGRQPGSTSGFCKHDKYHCVEL